MMTPPAGRTVFELVAGPIDRHAVMGDFKRSSSLSASREAHGLRRGGYWTQTLLSILPNVIRRVQGEAARRRTGETEAAQANRMTIRSKLLFVVAFVGLCLAVPDSWPGLRMGAYLVLLAPFMALLATFWIAPHGDVVAAARQRRRSDVSATLLWASVWPLATAHTDVIGHELKLAAFVADARPVVALRYRIFGLAFLNRHVVPQVKSPYFVTRTQAITRFQAVDAPSQPRS